MKTQLQNLLIDAVAAALPDVALQQAPHIERTRDPKHGDFASNIAMTLAGQAKRAPRQIAEAIIAALPESDLVDRAEIAGPGFINFHLKPSAFRAVISEVLKNGASFGRGQAGAGVLVMVEFVSANPTGPLHVGHGRGAAYGDCVARLLAASGFAVHREYYINDAGRQMDILALSLWLRYLQTCGEPLEFPANAYQGDYIVVAAERLWGEAGEQYRQPASALEAALAQSDAPDAMLDALIVQARELLGDDGFRRLLDFVLKEQVADIENDLGEFGVGFDQWFSERSLVDNGAVQHALERLQQAGHVYEHEGATWFKSSEFGDEKDRVLVRANGSHTYFAADIAYHLNKLDRGYQRLIDVWGADHHGYVPRVRAAVTALSGEADRLTVQLVQFAILYRGKERLAMSTRAGQYVTLRELRDEVGVDAARYFYVMRSNDQHLDFDLDLAKSQSNDNPVYYIQYAHARICRVAEQLSERGDGFATNNIDDGLLSRLDSEHEQRLITALARYPEVVEAGALNYAPQTVAHYLRDLADAFHSYYNAHTFLVEDASLRNARLALVFATRIVIANGLELLGVSAPESM